ncbi:MAG: heme ABC exporter ATP-binding protein CcmA [Rickettsiales bacterium]|nr:heme ABC exporter ATP-binding protein CcmA [Rickettsiales bacterium]|tara:strand:+ start:9058 stop:9699 length:642 start_codon:yes stop_codon:yes gene_type:complete
MAIGSKTVDALTFDPVKLRLDQAVVAHAPAFISKPVSITVQNGDLIQLTGANGVGKSTLLRAIAGFISLHTGMLLYKPQENVQPQRVYLGTKPSFHQSYTVKQQLKLWHQTYTPPESVNHYLNLFDLESIQSSPIKHLSTGQKQRVALVKVLMSNKPIWLLDEPFNNLDTPSKTQFASIINDHLKKGGIVIYTSHEKILGLSPQQINLDPGSK